MMTALLLKTPTIRQIEARYGCDLPDALTLLYEKYKGTAEVAQCLGIMPATLRSWLRKLGAEENLDGTLKLNARPPVGEVRVVE